MIQQRLTKLSIPFIAFLALGGCEREEKAGYESSNLERLQDALPGAQVEPFDPAQLKKLGPSEVPGILPDSELNVRRRKALAGDGAAAYQLFHHYQLVGNHAQSEYWARIGAENGEYNSMMLLGFASGREGGLDGCVRAVYWFMRARSELESELKSMEAGAHQDEIEALIQSADDEVTSVKRRVAGC